MRFWGDRRCEHYSRPECRRAKPVHLGAWYRLLRLKDRKLNADMNCSAAFRYSSAAVSMLGSSLKIPSALLQPMHNKPRGKPLSRQ